MNYDNPKLLLGPSDPSEGEIAWQSPSNIALVKYWGKHGRQLPRNPSISFTLQAAKTETRLAYSRDKDTTKDIDLTFFFEGEENPAFGKKVQAYFASLTDVFPFLRQLKMVVHSSNSFPHSSGIASSASGMSALALCLCSLESRLFGTLKADAAFRQKASFLARLGSGSACRSIYAGAAVWGHSSDVPDSSDLYAVPYHAPLHPVFQDYHDDILIVSQGEKAVSSRAGHALMEQNDYAPPRYQQARRNLQRLLPAMQAGDLETFGQIVEQEALSLHALMMASNPPYILMRPNTLEIINRIRDFRKRSGWPAYFTLDAGPNIHLLYPHHVREEVGAFVEEELRPLCEDGRIIADKVGLGPLEL